MFTPVTGSFGSIFVERPETLGQGKFEFGLSYAYVNFKQLNGTDLDKLNFTLHHNDCCDGDPSTAFARLPGVRGRHHRRELPEVRPHLERDHAQRNLRRDRSLRPEPAAAGRVHGHGCAGSGDDRRHIRHGCPFLRRRQSGHSGDALGERQSPRSRRSTASLEVSPRHDLRLRHGSRVEVPIPHRLAGQLPGLRRLHVGAILRDRARLRPDQPARIGRLPDRSTDNRPDSRALRRRSRLAGPQPRRAHHRRHRQLEPHQGGGGRSRFPSSLRPISKLPAASRRPPPISNRRSSTSSRGSRSTLRDRCSPTSPRSYPSTTVGYAPTSPRRAVSRRASDRSGAPAIREPD